MDIRQIKKLSHKTTNKEGIIDLIHPSSIIENLRTNGVSIFGSPPIYYY